MVECHLAKVDVEGSNPFSRSDGHGGPKGPPARWREAPLGSGHVPRACQDARRLIVHRCFGGAGCDRDLSVALSCGDESQDVELALGERDRDGRGGNAGREAGEAANDALGDRGVDERPSRRDGTHGLGELFARDVFEEETASGEPYRFDRNRIVVCILATRRRRQSRHSESDLAAFRTRESILEYLISTGGGRVYKKQYVNQLVNRIREILDDRSHLVASNRSAVGFLVLKDGIEYLKLDKPPGEKIRRRFRHSPPPKGEKGNPGE